MQTTNHFCFDCGSKAARTSIYEVRPLFRMDEIYFPCGAILRSSTSVHGQLGKISHKGCRAAEQA